MARDNHSTVPLSATQILDKVADRAQIAQGSAAYTETRRYTLRNERFRRQAEMTVRVTRRPDAALQFEELDVTGSEDVHRRVFRKLFEAETELSRLPAADRGLQNANYEAELLGAEVINNRHCYLLEVRPRRKSKYLLQGQAWIDAATFSLVKLEGRPTASLSLWVGKPLIVQEFKEVSGIWVAADSHSTSQTRLLGTTELTIAHRDQQFLPEPTKIAAARAVRLNEPGR